MAEPIQTNHSHDRNEPSAFIRSVIELSPDDIVKTKKKKKSPLDFVLDNLRYVIFAICAAVLVWSVFYIADTLRQYAEAENVYNGLGNLVVGNADIVEMMYLSPKTPATPDYDASQDLTADEIKDITGPVKIPVVNKDFERVKNQLVPLKQKFPDLYGWITIPGTVINYPVMQTDNNDYYLNRSYEGKKLKAGAIFADYRNSRDLLKNENLVLYGHHMTNNTMFHSLDKYLDRSFFEGNNIVQIYTLDGMFTYKVFAVYETNKFYRYIQTSFDSKSDYLTFIKEIEDHSIYKASDVVLNSDSKIITLSTCTNRSDDGRLAVHAVLIDTYLVGE